VSINQFKQSYLSANEDISVEDLVRNINLLQGNIAGTLNPLASKVQNDASNLTSISLKTGKVNIINHRLGRKLLGYNVMLKGKNPTAIISNDQDNNPSPTLTLWLYTSANCEIDLQVY